VTSLFLAIFEPCWQGGSAISLAYSTDGAFSFFFKIQCAVSAAS